MNHPPSMIDGAAVLFWAETAGIAKANACTFRANGEVQSQFAGLVIARYVGDPSCYLFLCNENWETQNDTFHRNVNEARDFAEELYPGIGARWRVGRNEEG